MFTEQDIRKVIENSGLNKAHGHDMISIQMLKVCGKSIVKPLQIIYKQSLEKGCFSDKWRKAHIVPVHRKNKQLLKNY